MKKFRGYYSVSVLESFGLRSFFTTRHYHLSRSDIERRRKLCADLKIKISNLILPKQVHGDSIIVADESYLGKSHLINEEADAVMTNVPGLAIGVLTADCLPIFIYDKSNKAIAMLHCGWRPLSKGIISKSVKLMSKKFLTDPQSLIVVFGPSIKGCCYEVGKEMRDFFKDGFIKRNNSLYLDLCEPAKKELLDCGVREKNIFESRICTSCMNDEFFSYRREGVDAGRSLSLLGLS